MYEENQYVDSELKNFGKLFNEGISVVLFVEACLFYYKRFVFTSANITSQLGYLLSCLGSFYIS